LYIYKGEQKRAVLSVPLNANELLLVAQRAELQQSPFTSQTSTENFPSQKSIFFFTKMEIVKKKWQHVEATGHFW